MAESYKEAATYTTVVVATGYAAFFTVWAFTRRYLSPSAELWAALLMLVSVASFVFWEVYQVVKNAMDFRALARELGGSSLNLAQLLHRWGQEKLDRDLRTMKYWWLSIVLAVGPAIAAFAILIYSLVRALVLRAI